jgi:hypothetical protein
VVVSDTPSAGSVSIEHVAVPIVVVCAWHRGLPSAVNETQAPATGDPVLVNLAVNTYSVPVSDRDGADTVNVLGACPTERVVSTVLDSKSEIPEYVAVTV